jgi:2-polyprenyl-6-methoxyphenol hydroxylase-like FAD-dependent oxidoreductase
MEEALLVPNIRIFFEHKPQMVDFHHRLMNVQDVVAGRSKQVEFDLCVGADGSHSFVRRQIMRVTRCLFFVLYCHSSSPAPPRLRGHVWNASDLDNWANPFIRWPEWTISKSTSLTNIWSSRCHRLTMEMVILHSLLIQITSIYGHAIHLCLWGCPIRCALFSVYIIVPSTTSWGGLIG